MQNLANFKATMFYNTRTHKARPSVPQQLEAGKTVETPSPKKPSSSTLADDYLNQRQPIKAHKQTVILNLPLNC